MLYFSTLFRALLLLIFVHLVSSKEDMKLGGVFFKCCDTFDIPQGIEIAFEEVNRKNISVHYNFKYELLSYDGRDRLHVMAYYLTKKLIVNHSVLALLAPTLTTLTETMNLGLEYNVSIITFRSNVAAFTKKYKMMLMVKLKDDTTIFHLLRYALRRYGCVYAGIVMSYKQQKSQLMIMSIQNLYSSNFATPPDIIYYIPTLSDNIQNILNFIFDTKFNRTCLYMFVLPKELNILFEAMNRDKRFIFSLYNYFAFFTSYDRRYWNPDVRHIYAHLSLLSYIPGISDTTSQLAVNYNNSLTHFLKAHPNKTCVINNKTYKIPSVQSEYGFIGYLIGYYVAKLISDLTNWYPTPITKLKPEDIVSAVYRYSVMVQDFVLFSAVKSLLPPYYEEEEFCNTVNKVVYIMSVSQEDGTLHNVNDTATDYSSDAAGALDCVLPIDESSDLFPYHIYAYYPDTIDSYNWSENAMLSRICEIAANQEDVGNYVVVEQYRFSVMNNTPQQIRSQASSFLRSYRPMLYSVNGIGERGVVMSDSPGDPPILFSYGFFRLHEEPKLISRKEGWNPRLFNFYPVETDTTMTAVTYYLQIRDNIVGVPYFIVSSQKDVIPTKKVLETKRIENAEVSLIKNIHVISILNILNGNGFVQISIRRYDELEYLNTVLSNAVSGVLMVTGPGGMIHKMMKTNNYYGNTSKISSGLTALFISMMDSWWHPGSLLFRRIISIAEPHRLNNPQYIFFMILGYFYSTIARGIVVKADVAELIYSQKMFSIFGSNYGPFSNLTCPESVIKHNEINRICQCTKGPRNYYLHNFIPWTLNLTDFSYSPHYISGCGVEYIPKPATKKKMYALIGVLCGLFVLISTALGIFFFIFLDPNKNAPKDDSIAFSMAFTDIQSSTALWSRVPELMGAAVQKHHELIRKIIETYKGYEVKTIGDSFMVAFKQSDDAVRFGLVLQIIFYETEWPPKIDESYIGFYAQLAENEENQELCKLYNRIISMPPETYSASWNGIRVRVGEHYGFGCVQKDPVSKRYDYYGTVVNTTARVEGIGHGGQLLITDSLYQNLLEMKGETGLQEFFEGVSCQNIGLQPLRGLEQPVELYQLLPTQLAERTFPPLRLDIENAGIGTDNDDNGDTTMGTVDARMTLEERIAKVISKHNDAKYLKGTRIGGSDVLMAYGVLSCLIAPLQEKEQVTFLKKICKAWHVKFRVIEEKVRKRQTDCTKNSNRVSRTSGTRSSRFSESVTATGTGQFDPYVKPLLDLAYVVLGAAHINVNMRSNISEITKSISMKKNPNFFGDNSEKMLSASSIMDDKFANTSCNLSTQDAPLGILSTISLFENNNRGFENTSFERDISFELSEKKDDEMGSSKE